MTVEITYATPIPIKSIKATCIYDADDIGVPLYTGAELVFGGEDDAPSLQPVGGGVE